MTNADRIRNLSDEQLAEFLLLIGSSGESHCTAIEEGSCKWEDYPTHDRGCKDCCLEWLQAEA